MTPSAPSASAAADILTTSWVLYAPVEHTTLILPAAALIVAAFTEICSSGVIATISPVLPEGMTPVTPFATRKSTTSLIPPKLIDSSALNGVTIGM